MKKILLFLCFTVILKCEIFSQYADTAALRTEINNVVKPNANLTGSQLNKILRGFLQFLKPNAATTGQLTDTATDLRSLANGRDTVLYGQFILVDTVDGKQRLQGDYDAFVDLCDSVAATIVGANFANANLTATGDRSHDFNQHSLLIDKTASTGIKSRFNGSNEMAYLQLDADAVNQALIGYYDTSLTLGSYHSASITEANTGSISALYSNSISVKSGGGHGITLTSVSNTTSTGSTIKLDSTKLTIDIPSKGIGKVLTSDANGNVTFVTPTSNVGTVTDMSVVSANGFAGSVANSTSTPAITLTTTVTGLLKGNGTAISAATAGTDYAPATSGSGILKGNGIGGFSPASAGTDYMAVVHFIYGERFTGSTSATITLAHAYTSGTIRVFKNGVRLDQTTDFTEATSTTLTLTDTRLSGDIFLIDYNY